MRTTEAITIFLEEHCRYQQLAPKTQESYLWALNKLSAQYPTLPTERPQLRRLISSQHLAPESLRDIWRNLKAFYSWMHTEGYIEDNPMKGMAPPGRRSRSFPRALSEDEVQRLISMPFTRRDTAILLTALDTGARLNEIALMRWADVTAEGIVLHGKGKKDRKVPLSSQVRRILLGLGDSDHIWTGRQGPLTRSGIQLLVRKNLYRAGIFPPKAGPHVLRHTFGSLFVKNGGNLAVLSRLMGHSKIETTTIYVHMSEGDLIEPHRRYSPLANISQLSHYIEEVH